MVLEVMLPQPAIRNQIREDKIHQIYSQMQLGQAKFGMQTANQALFAHFQKKFITMEMALEYSSDPEELRNMIAAGGTAGPSQRPGARLSPVFAWEGRTRTGEVKKGTMDADAEPE